MTIIGVISAFAVVALAGVLNAVVRGKERRQGRNLAVGTGLHCGGLCALRAGGLEVQIYTDNSAGLGQKLDRDLTKTSVVAFAPLQAVTPGASSLGQSI